MTINNTIPVLLAAVAGLLVSVLLSIFPDMIPCVSCTTEQVGQRELWSFFFKMVCAIAFIVYGSYLARARVVHAATLLITCGIALLILTLIANAIRMEELSPF